MPGLGAEAQAESALDQPCNSLEKAHDPSGSWRQYVNQQLAHEYPSLFATIDYWIMLKAPSFDCVLDWRLEQETRLAEKLGSQALQSDSKVMNREEVLHFIEHYQRTTEQLLQTLPQKVDRLLELDSQRRIVASHTR